MQSPTALRDDHTGGPGYRWALKGASTSMKTQQEWDLAKDDYLAGFISTLPQPLRISKQSIPNMKSGLAEVFILQYRERDFSRDSLWHGTHIGGARRVLWDGRFLESCDPQKHEFSLPGVYTSTNPMECLEPYAVSTMMTDVWHWATPYVKPIFLVQKKGSEGPVRVRGTEELYRAEQLEVVELHLLRGWDFKTAAGKYDVLTKADAESLRELAPKYPVADLSLNEPWTNLSASRNEAPTSSWATRTPKEAPTSSWASPTPKEVQAPPTEVKTVAPPTSLSWASWTTKEAPTSPWVASSPPPPPPSIDWHQYIYSDEVANRKVPYYHNKVTEEKTWTMPTQPFYPALTLPPNGPEAVLAPSSSTSEPLVSTTWSPSSPSSGWSWNAAVYCDICGEKKTWEDFYKKYQKFSAPTRVCKGCC